MRPHLTVEQRQLAPRLKAKGLSLREIGPQMGCLLGQAMNLGEWVPRRIFVYLKLGQGRGPLCNVLAEQVRQQRDDARDVGGGERIVYGLRFATGLDELVLAQSREMLRQRGLAEAQGALQFRDACLTIVKFAKDHQPVPISQRLQEPLRFSGFGSELG